MSFLISDAWAAAPAAAGAQGNPLIGLLPFVLIFVVFYFLLIRPQSKRQKEHKQMVANLSKGDEVVTSGGLLGRITELEENFVVVEVADGVRVKIQRTAISALMPKGTIKNG